MLDNDVGLGLGRGVGMCNRRIVAIYLLYGSVYQPKYTLRSRTVCFKAAKFLN